jgi:predicted esterase
MTMVRRILATLVGVLFVVLSAREAAAAPAWCGEGTEALPSDVCYIDGRKAPEARRTLVIWLHGVIAKDSDWSHNHEKMLSRMAKGTGIEMLFPKGITGESVVGWPGTADAQAKNEAELIEQWMTAKAILEKRQGGKFDQTFIFGFSSGAYFASSLAMRGRVDVDGYAVFAGGQPMAAAATPAEHFAPVYVGVCANDKTTVNHSRAFAASLAAASIPRMVNEQAVGHDVSSAHFLGALGYLRSKKAVAESDHVAYAAGERA